MQQQIAALLHPTYLEIASAFAILGLVLLFLLYRWSR